MEECEQVLLVREPENPFDLNAISVQRANGRQIGYLRRELAARLASSLDAYGKPVMAMVTDILGRDHIDGNLGVRIRFCLPECEQLGHGVISTGDADESGFPRAQTATP